MYFLKKINTTNKGAETIATAAICKGKFISPGIPGTSKFTLRKPLVTSWWAASFATKRGQIQLYSKDFPAVDFWKNTAPEKINKEMPFDACKAGVTYTGGVLISISIHAD